VIVNPDDLSCKELVELVTSYLEDRLPPAERTRFEMHLSYCAPCRVYLDQMRQTIQAAERLSERTLPPARRRGCSRLFATGSAAAEAGRDRL
jgi:anti-sigma factor RsiW